MLQIKGVLMSCRNAHRVFGTFALAALAACAATRPAVVPVGEDAFRVRVSGEAYETQADTNLKALNVADAYCGKLAKHVMFRQSTEINDHTWSGKQEDLTFVCMDTKDPAYMRPSVEHAASVVAQQ
jgi:hypothetical protein